MKLGGDHESLHQNFGLFCRIFAEVFSGIPRTWVLGERGAFLSKMPTLGDLGLNASCLFPPVSYASGLHGLKILLK